MTHTWTFVHMQAEKLLKMLREFTQIQHESKAWQEVYRVTDALDRFMPTAYDVQMDLMTLDVVPFREKQFGFHLASLMTLREAVSSATDQRVKLVLVHTFIIMLAKLAEITQSLSQEEIGSN